MEDKQIVDLYWSRCESAISETDKKYGRYCHYIAYSILNSEEDAKEIVNDTYLKTWNTVPPNRPDPLKSYVGTISRQLSLNRYEAMHAKKRTGHLVPILDELAECIPDRNSADISDSIAVRDALDRFVGALPKKTRRVFVRRYWYASPISEIAAEYAMKESSVTVLLLRTRKKLKAFLEKEGLEV